jgi:protein-tyrosine phosphatase
LEADIFWVTPNLAILARPRAGDWLRDEITSWKIHGIRCVVSLLEPYEVLELGLEQEPHLCTELGIQHYSFAVPDRGLPDGHALTALLMDLRRRHAPVGKVGVHCRAGIGRSALLVGAMLVADGLTADAALAQIAEARGVAVPDTEAQRDWLRKWSYREERNEVST